MTAAAALATPDELESAEPQWPATPLGLLARLAYQSEISAIERDAGEIFHHIGRIAINDAKPSAFLQYPWRDKAGMWSTVSEPKRLIIDKYETALESANTDRRRKVIIAALVARDPVYADDTIHVLSSALESIAAVWWGRAAIATSVRNGITLAAGPRTIDYDNPPANDNTPTPERANQGDAVTTPDGTRMRDSFERLLVRGQLDEDAETATTLYAAGVRYQTDYQLAQMVNFGSFDYAKPMVDGGADATPITERVQMARTTLRAARAAMGDRLAEIVDGVAIHGMTLEGAGRRYTAYRGVNAATTAARERLNAGLRALAVFYGIAVRRAG